MRREIRYFTRVKGNAGQRENCPIRLEIRECRVSLGSVSSSVPRRCDWAHGFCEAPIVSGPPEPPLKRPVSLSFNCSRENHTDNTESKRITGRSAAKGTRRAVRIRRKTVSLPRPRGFTYHGLSRSNSNPVFLQRGVVS